MSLTTNKEKLLIVIEQHPEAKKALMLLFPECFEQVDISNIHISNNDIIDVRGSGNYRGVSFWLNEENYNWEFTKDSIGELCLIPTKK